jgi:hypothetical protein
MSAKRHVYTTLLFLLESMLRPKSGPMRQQKRCPSCGSPNVHRSHRKGLVERVILPLLHLRPYRCEDCDARFLFGHSTSPGVQLARFRARG